MRIITLGRGAKISLSDEEEESTEIDEEIEIHISKHPETFPEQCELVIDLPDCKENEKASISCGEEIFSRADAQKIKPHKALTISLEKVKKCTVELKELGDSRG